MSARYYAKLYERRAWDQRFDALLAAESEVNRKEERLKAMLECLGEVAVDIPCYGDSFAEEERCSVPIRRFMQPAGGWFSQDHAASRYAAGCSHPARGVT